MNSAGKKTLGWVWWVIFPPYAFYRLLRSRLKWYFKVPLILVSVLIAALAYDMATAPHRVEEAKAEKVIQDYLKSESGTINTRVLERLGEGASVTKKKNDTLVFYKVVADEQLYQIGLGTTTGNNLVIEHAEQLYPIRMGMKSDENRTRGEIAVWLKKHEAKLGKATRLVSESEDGMEQVVKTTKGTFTFNVGNQSVYLVKDSKRKTVFEKENEPVLPAKVMTYLKENEKKAGTFVRTLGFELDDEKQHFYFRTEKGDFLAEIYDNGSIELKKKR